MLAVIEKTRLFELEAVIERGLKTFVDVGNALLEIRDSRLYRAEFATFEDYCRDKWNMERAHAYRMIEAARVVNVLSPIGDIFPTTESQARPLTQFEPEQQITVWQQVVDTAPNGKITAAHVQSVVDEVKDKPHVSFNSGNNEWYTPIEYIDAAYKVMGGIDLDPASSDTANQTVGAEEYFTAEDDGLLREWSGRVWMNPPYSSGLIDKFSEKLVKHFRLGDISQAIVLVNNATETEWFQTMLPSALAVCLIRRRVKFIDMDGNPSGAPLQGQVILYFGGDATLFGRVFSKFGGILYAI